MVKKTSIGLGYWGPMGHQVQISVKQFERDYIKPSQRNSKDDEATKAHSSLHVETSILAFDMTVRIHPATVSVETGLS